MESAQAVPSANKLTETGTEKVKEQRGAEEKPAQHPLWIRDGVDAEAAGKESSILGRRRDLGLELSPADPQQLSLRWRKGNRGAPPEEEDSTGSGRRATEHPATLEGEDDGLGKEEGSCLPKSFAPKEVKQGQAEEEESLMRELSALVQKVVKGSSWWERHGIDGVLLALALTFFAAGFFLLQSDNLLLFCFGIFIQGVAHSAITVKGSHMASHHALTESRFWSRIWAVFFMEICGSFPAHEGVRSHVKLHHAYTNVIGLGDSSVWKIPALSRYIYLFLAPLALPILTPLMALGFLKNVDFIRAVRSLCFICLGLCSHCWLLLEVSGFQTAGSALFFMFLIRAILAIPFIHVNIFQHIGLPMFSLEKKPKRIQQMSHAVLNLPRHPLLDWTFGHAIVNCHVEHHLFPSLSDNMCLKIKPLVSQYLTKKNLPYNEDSYLSRLRMFIQRYEELMVQVPPITQLVGIQ
uniref:Fatty acid desaturase 6 n=1 Tax=Geotrypetes seraphini TaxID=260995 RepID=A0A6P8SPQ1_GEOSA|nr:fatty acid desaturase 6 [Geotrypetes seraphini]